MLLFLIGPEVAGQGTAMLPEVALAGEPDDAGTLVSI